MSSSLLSIHNQPKDSRCIGSSHGWLILLKQETTPYLFNPCSGFQIQLPSNAGLQHEAGRLVRKAVLSADPCKNKEYVVIVIYGFESKIGLFRMSSGWHDLNGKHMSDVICRNNMLFALDERCNIGVWDFRGGAGASSSNFPIKVRDIRPSFPRKAFDIWGSMKDLCCCRWYVVEWSGDIWVVCRVVGEYVRDGVAIYEAELLEGETNHPLVCPYKTLNFQVYRLDSQKNEWEEVETIGDRILFLGGNHSVSVSTHQLANHNHCRTNSIYFTDDYWDRINDDYLYGGHDLGVYSMEDKSVKEVYEFDLDRIEPPPFWVLPTQSYTQPCTLIFSVVP